MQVKVEDIGAVGYEEQEKERRRWASPSKYLVSLLPLYIQRDQESLPSSIFFCNAFCP